MESETQREFDIVVYGATGFTGALVAEYLHEVHGDINWAIAGRSQTKLDAVKHRLGAPDLPTLVADSDSTEDMTRLATQSRRTGTNPRVALDLADVVARGKTGRPA